MVGTPQKTAGDRGEGGRSNVQGGGSVSQRLKERRGLHTYISRKKHRKATKTKKNPKEKKNRLIRVKEEIMFETEIKTIQ